MSVPKPVVVTGVAATLLVASVSLIQSAQAEITPCAGADPAKSIIVAIDKHDGSAMQVKCLADTESVKVNQLLGKVAVESDGWDSDPEDWDGTPQRIDGYPNDVEAVGDARWGLFVGQADTNDWSPQRLKADTLLGLAGDYIELNPGQIIAFSFIDSQAQQSKLPSKTPAELAMVSDGRNVSDEHSTGMVSTSAVDPLERQAQEPFDEIADEITRDELPGVGSAADTQGKAGTSNPDNPADVQTSAGESNQGKARTQAPASASQSPQTPYFLDVPASDQFFNEINWMGNEGYASGWTTINGHEYRPLELTHRDAMAAFFYRLAGSENYTPPAISPFSDVSTDNPFYKEICWLEVAGITTGYSDGTFHPLDTVNRDAMAAFIYRYDNEPDYESPTASPFKDVQPGQLFFKEMVWMQNQGLAKGWPDGTFRPLQPIARDAMAAFIYRLENSAD